MTAPQLYAHALRVIGQEVLKLRPVSLELQLVGDAYLVSGTFSVKFHDRPHRGTWNVLESWLKTSHKKPAKDESQPFLTSFSLRFTPGDIEQLDKLWAANRGKTDKTPDLKSLPELLRTVGEYIDSEGDDLVKLLKEDHTLVLYCRDEEGNLKAKECDLMALYKEQQVAISRRENMAIKDLWGERPL